jgi:glycosidase
MLDGVFNHTGYDSRYFNGRGTYPEPGAHQSKDSRYYPWYDFQAWPFAYSSWWGIYTLPQVNEMNPDYMSFILDGPDSVIRHWLRAGASGWRLDVADELPDAFIERLRAAARAEKPDAVVIGEVWEDASTKISYDCRRRYLLGRELDGVMNYPLRDALLGYLLGGDAARFRDELETLRENYPKPAFYSLMNILGTHDTPRALTVLGAEGPEYQLPRGERAAFRLPPEARARAVRRLKIAALLQFSFPGSPCVYYGDEAGLEGFEDPFNRRGFPWGREEPELVSWYARLGALRNRSQALQAGDLEYLRAEGRILAFARTAGGERAVALANAGPEPAVFTTPWKGQTAADAMTGVRYPVKEGTLTVELPALTGMLLVSG